MRNGASEGYWPSPQGEAEKQLLHRADLRLSTAWQAPQTETELNLADVWRRVLGVDTVGSCDDFFELGGDSFAATTLASEIEATFGIQFAPSRILDLQTVARQALAIQAETASDLSQLPSCLVAGRTTGSKSPLFMVHGGSGFAFLQPIFVDLLGEDRPVYFFQAPGLDGRGAPLTSIDEISRLYVRSMRELQPHGPYNIGAMCSGSFIALEMCNQIQDDGETIGHLILLDPDTMPPAWKKQRARPGSKVRVRTALDRIPPERRTHVTKSMLTVVQELHTAVSNYVPRPYSGKTAVLVNSRKARKIVDRSGFWPTHLKDMEYEVWGADHEEVFGAKLADTARFVRKILDS